jgi:hypothetical protein
VKKEIESRNKPSVWLEILNIYRALKIKLILIPCGCIWNKIRQNVV